MSFTALSTSSTTSIKNRGLWGMVRRKKMAIAAGTAPRPTTHRHVRSRFCKHDPFKAATPPCESTGTHCESHAYCALMTIKAIAYTRIWPIACIQKTKASIRARCLRGANSEVITALCFSVNAATVLRSARKVLR